MPVQPVFTDTPHTFTGDHLHIGKVGFYGQTPPAQRVSTSLQRTSNLSTVTGTISASTAAINQIIGSLQEVMNTLAAHGLWAVS